MATSILGADDAALGNLILGVVPVEELLIAATSGLVAFYKCDVGVGASNLPDSVGGFNASVSGTGNAITQYGIDSLSLTLPNATPAGSPPPYTKDTTPHSHYKYSGNDIPIGTTGSILLWFTPTEFGDEKRVPGGMIPSTDQTYYDIVRLSNDSTGLAVAIRATQTNPDPGPYVFTLNWNSDAGLTGDSHFSYFGLMSNLNFFDNRFIAPVPPIVLNKPYLLVLAWDSTSINGFINGQLCFSGSYFEIPPPADLGGACSFKIGDCGGSYDLVSLFNRKLTPDEVNTFYRAALNTVQQNLVVTQLFANYAATFDRNLRVTNERTEVLRTGLRNLRITKEFIEVLRSVRFGDNFALQTLVFNQTVNGYVGQDVHQTLNFTQTVHVDLGVHNVVQVLHFTEIISIAGSEHHQGIFQTLVFTQNEKREIDINRVQVLNFIETTTAISSHEVKQTLHFIETLIALGHEIDKTITQTLTYHETAWINGPNGLFPVSGQLEYPLGDIVLSGEGGAQAFDSTILTFNQNVTVQVIHNLHVTDHLDFIETVHRQMEYHRSFTDHLVFLDGYNKALDLFIGGQQVVVPIPTVYVSIIGRSTRYVIIQSKNSVIVLPTPEWGDSEQTGNVVNVKRAMTGKVYTYVKTANWHKLHYDFIISRKKAKELEVFLRDNLSEVLTLTNWKGQVYKGQIIQNPTNLVASGRYAPAYEKVTMAFEFEGVRVHG